MLVEVDSVGGLPMLLEVRQVYPEKTIMGKQTGRTVLDSLTRSERWNSGYQTSISLNYDQFKWALTASTKRGDPFLDLTQKGLDDIRSSYQSLATKLGGLRSSFSPP